MGAIEKTVDKEYEEEERRFRSRRGWEGCSLAGSYMSHLTRGRGRLLYYKFLKSRWENFMPRPKAISTRLEVVRGRGSQYFNSVDDGCRCDM